MARFIPICIFIICNCLLHKAVAQKHSFLTEKVYLAPASSHYFRGDTIQISGQLLSSDYEDFYPYSRYVYIELLNEGDSILIRQKLPCDPNGSFYATVPVDYEWPDNVYYLRGYSQFMQNIPTQYFPTFPLLIGKRQQSRNEPPLNAKARFFPEGGKWISGKTQKVTVCFTDEYDYPIETKFYIINNRQDTVAVGKSYLSGLGTFTLSPQKGEYYQLKAQIGYQEYSYPLPIPKDRTSLQVILNNQRLICKILSSDTEKIENYHLYAYHSDFGLQELPIQQETALADISGSSPGIITVWLTDETGQPLAERNLWIVPTPERKITIDVPEKCILGQMPIISVKNMLSGSRSIMRIVPEWDDVSTQAFENFQFRHQLYSPLPFPRFYHRESPDKARKELDAWLLTTISAMLPLPVLTADSILYPFTIEKNLMLSGNVKKSNGKPIDYGNVQLFHTSAQEAYTANTDSTGAFGVIVKDFADKESFYVQAYDKKGRTDKYVYHINEAIFPIAKNRNRYKIYSQLYAKTEVITIGDTLDYAMSPDSTKIYELGNVTVKAKTIRKDRDNWFHQKTPLNYIDRKTLEQPNIMTLEDAIRRFIKVYLKRVYSDDPNNQREEGRVIQWKVPPFPAFMPSIQGHGGWLDLVIDGILINRGYEDFLTMSTAGMESVELVSPRDSRCLIYDAPYGFIEVKRRITMNKSEIPSNGITIHPKGISYPLKPDALKLPNKPGNYRLLIDIISPDRRIYSFDKPITIY